LNFDLTSIEARIRDREKAIRSGGLSHADLEALRTESVQLERELLRFRVQLTPEYRQITALLQQLRATRSETPPRLDVHF
jgi:hypothetical protein